MRVIFVYPPDETTGQLNNMHLLYMQALDLLQRQGRIEWQVVGRIPTARFRGLCDIDVEYTDFFKCGTFGPGMDSDEIAEAEKKAGLPFRYMLTCNQRRWGWYDSSSIPKAARYVQVWDTLLQHCDLLITTFDNLFFTYIADGVARHKGIRVMKPVKGRLVDDSVAFWDWRCYPVPSDNGGEVYNRFISRSAAGGQVRMNTSSVTDTSELGSRGMSVPSKIAMLLMSDRAGIDADVPKLNHKYTMLADMAVKILLYPHLHRVFYSAPKPGERFFLLPMHFEWEANMAYREPYLNQHRLIRSVLDSLPEGTWLYVKPHPHWRNCDQPIFSMFMTRFWNTRIRLLPPEADTTELVRKSAGVIAINSTVGYEALQHGKPLIAVGHEWFRYGGRDIKDMNHLPAALMEAVSGGRPDNGRNEAFLRDYAGRLSPSDDIGILAENMHKAMTRLVSA